MRKFVVFYSVLLVFSISAKTYALTTVYTNQTDFINAIQPNYYLEDFTAYTGGFEGTSLGFGPINGFAYTLFASKGLYSGLGIMSTNYPSEQMNMVFTGSEVTAIGGDFWLTDKTFGNLTGSIVLSLSDGTQFILPDTNITKFLGFISDGAAYTSMSFNSTFYNDNQYPTIDNIYAGAAVPAPAAVLLGGFGAGLVGLLRRKRAI
jgi:hypothetical protein